MRTALGSYTGTGVAFSVSGLGFTPDLVIVKSIPSSSAAQVRFRGQNYPDSFDISSLTPRANGITAIDADGFSIGTLSYVNTAGAAYLWEAFAGDTDGVCVFGEYTGNGTAQDITLGFQPDVIFLRADFYQATIQTRCCWALSSSAPGMTKDGTNAVDFANGVTAFNPTGFSLGSDIKVNRNATRYLYLAWRSIPGWSAVGCYQGNGIDDRNLTGLMDFAPDFVCTKGVGTQYNVRARNGFTGTNSQSWNTNQSSDAIQARLADGFQVGTNANVNSAGVWYDWFAFKAGEVPVTTITPKAGSDDGVASETAQIGLVKLATDAGTGSETVSGRDTGDGEHGATAETGTLAAQLSAVDSGIATETADSGAPLPRGDDETALADETASVVNLLSATDTGIVTETGLLRTAVDSVQLSSSIVRRAQCDVQFAVDIFRTQAQAQVALWVDICPRIIADVAFSVAIEQTAYRTAGEGRLLAPYATITIQE